MKFVAVDVETANRDRASICQIGVVVFEAGRVRETWHTLIDPEDDFDRVNTAIHGIRKADVVGAPTLPRVHAQLVKLMAGQVVVHHSPFDRSAFGKVAAKYDLPEIGCRWLDTVKVARRAWPLLADGGYGLANLTRAFGITFQHHAAHEDARAAGEIFLRAIADSGLSVSDWQVRVLKPVKPSSPGKYSSSRSGDSNPSR